MFAMVALLKTQQHFHFHCLYETVEELETFK